MILLPTRHLGRKLRYAWSLVAGRMLHVNLQILYNCNCRCRICDFWRGAYRDRPQMSVDQAAIVADKLNEIGPQIVSIGGGEPLLHPDLEALARTLARHHFPVLITNGTLVTPDRLMRSRDGSVPRIAFVVIEGLQAADEVVDAFRNRRQGLVEPARVGGQDDAAELEALQPLQHLRKVRMFERFAAGEDEVITVPADDPQQLQHLRCRQRRRAQGGVRVARAVAAIRAAKTAGISQVLDRQQRIPSVHPIHTEVLQETADAVHNMSSRCSGRRNSLSVSRVDRRNKRFAAAPCSKVPNPNHQSLRDCPNPKHPCFVGIKLGGVQGDSLGVGYWCLGIPSAPRCLEC